MVDIEEIIKFIPLTTLDSYWRGIMEDAVDEIKELRTLVKVLGNACDKVHKQAAIIQPFLGIWKEHGSTIEKYRNQS